MTGLAQIARQNLSASLASAGPEAPTLCEGWTTHDLAAHIVVRERRPDAAAGLIVPALAERSKAVMDQFREMPYDELVDMVRQGPRGLSPTRVPGVDDAINLAEFYIHHEDVLRADPSWSPEQARPLRDDAEDALWARLKQGGQLLFRRSPVGVVLDPDPSAAGADRGTRSVHGPTKLGTVTLSGAPSELILFAFGRSSVAQVRMDGDEAAIEALRSTKLSV